MTCATTTIASISSMAEHGTLPRSVTVNSAK
jgi:hypothetical protein